VVLDVRNLMMYLVHEEPLNYDDITGVMDVLAESGIPFDQLIFEYSSWIHVSFPRKYSEARKEVFQIDKKGVRVYNVGK
jgi:hypothetical protein